MSGRRGRTLDTVADGLIECSPASIYLWLLRTTRMANPDPQVHTQFRFGRYLGHDGTFVSHVESGRRPMPPHLQNQWFTAIGLDTSDVTDYLTNTAVDGYISVLKADSDEAIGLELVDNALEGAKMTPREWTIACSVAGSIRLPKTMQRFASLASDAMATSFGPGYEIMLGAVSQLPGNIVVRAVETTVDAAPYRGQHAVGLLGSVDAAQSGPVLRRYFQEMPDPWLERGVVESMRRLVWRGEVSTVADDPTMLQANLIDAMAEATSWMSRIELANLIYLLGPISKAFRNKLSSYADFDIQLAAGAKPTEGALAAVRALRSDAILATLDRMYGSPVSDPLADKLVGHMMLGRTERSRINAAQALALSPYSSLCIEVLSKLSRSAVMEIRRASAVALANFSSTDIAVRTLVDLAVSDPAGSVRARAVWSLIPHRDRLNTRAINTLTEDSDQIVRRAGVDLAGAMSNLGALRLAADDIVPQIADLAAHHLLHGEE